MTGRSKTLYPKLRLRICAGCQMFGLGPCVIVRKLLPDLNYDHWFFTLCLHDTLVSAHFCSNILAYDLCSFDSVLSTKCIQSTLHLPFQNLLILRSNFTVVRHSSTRNLKDVYYWNTYTPTRTNAKKTGIQEEREKFKGNLPETAPVVASVRCGAVEDRFSCKSSRNNPIHQ